MSLNIDDPEVELLARTLAERTGETVTQSLTGALRERLEREDTRVEERVAAAMAIGRHCAALPVRDGRAPDALLNYEEC